MKNKALRQLLLAFFIFAAIFANLFLSFSMVAHSCSAGKCYPCMLLDKLRDTYRLGAALSAAASLVLAVFVMPAVLGATQGNCENNLVGLKVRMNT